MSKFTTANGKPIDTFIIPNTSMLGIKFTQGGELPECLSGMYTSVRDADKAIVAYLETSKSKVGRPPNQEKS